MKHIREIVLRTRASLVRQINGLNEDVKSLEATIKSQNRRIAELETENQDKIQFLEREQDVRKNAETKRQEALTTRALKSDLKKEYGNTNWAKKVINRILKDRADEQVNNSQIVRGSE